MSKAKLQLTAASRWWSEHRSAEQAARWLDGFEVASKSLRDDPQQHALAPENEHFPLPYPPRQLVYGIGPRPTHRAVFEVRGDTVFVVAIRHLAEDDLPREEM
jgi:plasmid stabilization system protein ParE